MITNMEDKNYIKMLLDKDFFTEEQKKELFKTFPEFAESEDERIRKALIEVFKKKLERGFEWIEYGIPNRSVLDWLEKQKDASKAIEAVNRIDKYIDEHLANAHDMKDSNPDKKYYRGWDDALGKMSGILQDVYSNEKQKEQKPADSPAGFYVTLDGKKYYAKEMRCNGMNVKVVEPKPAEWSDEDIKKIRSEEYTKGFNDAAFGGKLKEWSVEDEDRIRQIERIAQQAGCTQKLQEEIHDWLKSLRPQPIQEWSEEDKRKLNRIYEILGQAADEKPFGSSKRIIGDKEEVELQDFLKILRPSWKPSAQELGALKTAVSVLTEERTFPKAAKQIQKIIDVFDGKELRKDWKPSEEQMEALNTLNLHGDLSYVGQQNQLISLYQDLKKLM